MISIVFLLLLVANVNCMIQFNQASSPLHQNNQIKHVINNFSNNVNNNVNIASDVILALQNLKPTKVVNSNNNYPFTIHGLWHNNDCSGKSGVGFSLSAIDSLVPIMNQVWMSEDGNNTAFWQHEWEKHGSCTGLTQYNFFSKTLTLFKQLNLTTVISTVGSQINLNNFVNYLNLHTGCVQTISCDNTNTVTELYFAYNSNYTQIINCNIKPNQSCAKVIKV